MKTWVLVWILVFPPEGVNKPTTWEFKSTQGMTMEQCFSELAEMDQNFKMLAQEGEILGHEIYCRDKNGN